MGGEPGPEGGLESGRRRRKITLRQEECQRSLVEIQQEPGGCSCGAHERFSRKRGCHRGGPWCSVRRVDLTFWGSCNATTSLEQCLEYGLLSTTVHNMSAH